MSVLVRLRRFWLDVHLWLGVGLFIPFVLLALSGAALTFHDEIERALHPQRYEVTAGPPVAAAELVRAAQGALGDGFVVSGLRFEAHADAPVVAQARAKGRPREGQRPASRAVYLDPGTARVLDIADPRAGAFGWLHRLHGSLLIPEIGRKVVGWMGWAMLASSLTGIWLWWPRNGAFLRGLRWRRGPRTTFNLHHLTGFWIAIPLAILSATGVYISFPQSARGLTQVFVPMTAPLQGPGRGGAPMERTRLSIDEAAALARAAAPEARLASISLPVRARGDGAAAAWRVELRQDGERVLATVDDRAGAVTVAPRAPGDGVPLLMRRIHDGVDQHIVWRVIVFLGGVIPALLGVTGIVMWLRRRAARRAVRRGAATDSN